METIDPNVAKKDEALSKALKDNKELEATLSRIKTHVAQGNITGLVGEIGGGPDLARNLSQQSQPVPQYQGNYQQYQQVPQNPQYQGPDPGLQLMMDQMEKKYADLESKMVQQQQANDRIQKDIDFKNRVNHHLSQNPEYYPHFRNSSDMWGIHILKNIMDNYEANNGSEMPLDKAMDETDNELKALGHEVLGHSNEEIEDYNRLRGYSDDFDPSEVEPDEGAEEEEVDESKLSEEELDERETKKQLSEFGDLHEEDEGEVDKEDHPNYNVMDKFSLDEDESNQDTNNPENAGKANDQSGNANRVNVDTSYL